MDPLERLRNPQSEAERREAAEEVAKVARKVCEKYMFRHPGISRFLELDDAVQVCMGLLLSKALAKYCPQGRWDGFLKLVCERKLVDMTRKAEARRKAEMVFYEKASPYLQDASGLLDEDDFVNYCGVHYGLGQREQTVLRMTFRGYTIQEIAKEIAF